MTNEATTTLEPPANSIAEENKQPAPEISAMENPADTKDGGAGSAGGKAVEPQKTYKTTVKNWTGKTLEIVNKVNGVKLVLTPQSMARGQKAIYPGIDEEKTEWELIESWLNTEKEPDSFRRWVAEKFNEDLLISWRTHQDETKFVTSVSDPSIARTPKSMPAHFNRLLMAKQKEIKDNTAKWSKADLAKAIEERNSLFAQYKEAMEKELMADMG